MEMERKVSRLIHCQLSLVTDFQFHVLLIAIRALVTDYVYFVFSFNRSWLIIFCESNSLSPHDRCT